MYDLATDIVNKGADLRRLDKYGNDALWTAVLNPRPSLPLIDLLVTKRADPIAKIQPDDPRQTWQLRRRIKQ